MSKYINGGMDVIVFFGALLGIIIASAYLPRFLGKILSTFSKDQTKVDYLSTSESVERQKKETEALKSSFPAHHYK